MILTAGQASKHARQGHSTVSTAKDSDASLASQQRANQCCPTCHVLAVPPAAEYLAKGACADEVACTAQHSTAQHGTACHGHPQHAPAQHSSSDGAPPEYPCSCLPSSMAASSTCVMSGDVWRLTSSQLPEPLLAPGPKRVKRGPSDDLWVGKMRRGPHSFREQPFSMQRGWHAR
jgi:hypothetical protein